MHSVIKRSKKNLLKGFLLSDYSRNDLARNEFSGFSLRLQQYIEKKNSFCQKEHIIQFRFIYLHYFTDQKHALLRSFYCAIIRTDPVLDHKKIVKFYYRLWNSKTQVSLFLCKLYKLLIELSLSCVTNDWRCRIFSIKFNRIQRNNSKNNVQGIYFLKKWKDILF